MTRAQWEELIQTTINRVIEANYGESLTESTAININQQIYHVLRSLYVAIPNGVIAVNNLRIPSVVVLLVDGELRTSYRFP